MVTVNDKVSQNVRSEFEPAELTSNARVVLEKRYLLKDHDGNFKETADELFRRVAKALAAPEIKYGATLMEASQTEEKFYRLMASLEFLPNSPTLMNAGVNGTLSACFVLPLTDSMKGIMKAAHDAAMVQKFGGGTGFSLSEIRPVNTQIASTHGKACGPIAVLRHLSSVSTLVTQGGKRDGANMAVMDVHHPDILEFIDCKATEGTIHNFNISVGASEEFMQAVEKNSSYPLRMKEDPADPDSQMVEVGRLDAREVFNKIIQGAWRNGEPGMIFLDTVNHESPVLHIGRITATNPCGEQPLLPNESCNLGSIDVGKFVVDEDSEEGAQIDWDRMEDAINTSIRMLDNVIDANQYAIPEIDHQTKLTRKLGLGVMGFADMLVKLGIAYDSEDGIELGRKLMKFFDDVSYKMSLKLAEQRGPFPGWKGSKFQKKGIGIRNACRLTVAPTGTISMIAGASSGIEPLFSLAYRKQNILGNETLYYVDKNFEKAARKFGFYSDDLMEFLSDGGSLQERQDVPDNVKRLFRTAPDISPSYHVKMQAAFQESTDAGISKTINFPNDATVKDVEEAYMLAWRTRCKGITVYRAGSRVKEVLTSGHKKDTATAEGEVPQQETLIDSGNGFVSPMERPRELYGHTRRVRTGRGSLYVTVNMNEKGQPLELFTAHGKAGGNDSAMAEAVSRLISLSLKAGVHPQGIVKQLQGITDAPVWDDGVLVRSVPDAIAHILGESLKRNGARPSSIQTVSSQAQMLPAEVEVEDNSAQQAAMVDLCPESNCSGSLVHEEGCVKCHSCGYSRC